MALILYGSGTLFARPKMWRLGRVGQNPGFEPALLIGGRFVLRVFKVWMSSLPVVVLLTQVSAHAQDTRGAILGRITDATGAVIVDATVVAVDNDTHVRTAATTNSSGDYLLPYLVVGTYRVSAEKAGFKKIERPDIQVRVSDRITIDFTMELGQASETVQVTAETPLVDTSELSMGAVVPPKTVVDLPLIAGNSIQQGSYVPGVLFMPTYPKDTRPFDTGSGSAIAGDGTLLGTAQFTLDGFPNNEANDKGFAYSPGPGMVEEIKVTTASFDASVGFMTGVVLAQSLKSGGNQPHGVMYYFLQDPSVDANKFFNNLDGIPVYAYRSHRYGANLNGPVFIPKLFDGRNKVFFLFGYEGMTTFDPVSIGYESVPTAPERNGDFSALLPLGTKYQIYDPYSAVPSGSGIYTRTPLPNNIIPQSEINPVGQAIVHLYDMPNIGGTADGTSNYTAGRNSHDGYFNYLAKVDYNISDKHRFFVRGDITRDKRRQDVRDNGANGLVQFRWEEGGAVDYVYTASPTFILEGKYSIQQYRNPYTADQDNWNLAGLGFSPTFINQINAISPSLLRLPEINVNNGLAAANAGVGGYSVLSPQDNVINSTTLHNMAVNATKIEGPHTLRFGVAFRVSQKFDVDPGASSGYFYFDSTWVEGPTSTSAGAPIGQQIAALLYGLPSPNSYFPYGNLNYAEESKIFATFLQDDWKVSRKLTLSLGLRYELPTPLTERYNRAVLGFNPTAASSIVSQVEANYAANPSAVPASQFNALGGLTYPGVGGDPRNLWHYMKTDIMPRFGLAYALTPKTILRGGYGIYFEPLGTFENDVNQIGFGLNTSMVASNNGGQSFVANLTNPFPNGFTVPLGAAGGANTSLGQSVTFINPNLKDPYVQRWQIAVQRALPGNSLVEVSYVGNHGIRQLLSKNLDALPDQYLSTTGVRNPTVINYLSAQVPNPFYPLLPGTGLAGATVARSQLLLPYPQFTAVNYTTNQGWSEYQALQSRFERRFTNGLQASVSWTWSKLMNGNDFLNAGDPMPEKVISTQDRPERIVETMIYQIPFGHGQRFGNKANGFVNAVLGGWQISELYQHQTGQAIAFGNVLFNGNLHNIPLPSGQRTIQEWFNTAAGFNTVSSQQLADNLRTFSSQFNGIRQDNQNELDTSLSKDFAIGEKGLHAQLRTDWFNAPNHPQFLAPNASPTSSAFGQVSGEWSSPRTIQGAFKLMF
jgi:Carboxypeptidase regulatory-like domain